VWLLFLEPALIQLWANRISRRRNIQLRAERYITHDGAQRMGLFEKGSFGGGQRGKARGVCMYVCMYLDEVRSQI
jgi:hypothetical protein